MNYAKVCMGLVGCIEQYFAVIAGIEPVIKSVSEFPDKITAAADGVGEDLGKMELMEKAKCGANIAKATKAATKCVQILLEDLNAVK